MNGRYHVIDEPSLSILSSFDSLDAALIFVETLRSVNADDMLDELTVSDDSGPVFYGESLRQELQRRARERARLGSRGSSGSGGAGSSDTGHGYAAIAATRRD